MAGQFNRTDRLGSQLQRDLSSLISQELRDPRLGMVTVQEVRVSRDLSHAKVFVTFMGETNIDESVEILNSAASHLRHLLGKSLNVRVIPELKFVFDESIEHGEQLSNLIDQVAPKDSDS